MQLLSQSQLLAALTLLLSASLFGATCGAYAQKAPQPEKGTEPLRRTWIRPAIAASTLGGSVGIFSVQHQRGANLFSARVAMTGGQDFPYSKTATEVGILYGRALSWSWGNASASAGVSFLGSGEVRDEPVPGVPAQAKVYASVPYTPFGISVGGTANLNTQRSFAGVTFGIVIGDLR